jgi:hypothetical protein
MEATRAIDVNRRASSRTSAVVMIAMRSGDHMETRIFWSVLLALLVFSGLAAVGRAVIQHRQEAAAVDASQAAFLEASGAAQAQRQLSIDESVQRQKRWSTDSSSRVLQDNMRCVGGVVVLVQSQHDYQQIGTLQNPVHCSGRTADHAVRVSM